MDKVILKDKKKDKVRKEQVYKSDTVNPIRSMDNHNIEDYHDYERMFETEPCQGRKKMDNVIIKKAATK